MYLNLLPESLIVISLIKSFDIQIMLFCLGFFFFLIKSQNKSPRAVFTGNCGCFLSAPLTAANTSTLLIEQFLSRWRFTFIQKFIGHSFRWKLCSFYKCSLIFYTGCFLGYQFYTFPLDCVLLMHCNFSKMLWKERPPPWWLSG